MNLAMNHEVVGSIPGLTQGLKIQHYCELCVGHRHGSDLALLWLWHRPAAVAAVRPLVWEPPYPMGAALKKKKTPKTNKNPQKQRGGRIPDS